MFYFVVVEFFSLTADEGPRTEKSCTVVAVFMLWQVIQNSKQPKLWLETESFQILICDVYKCLKAMNSV